MTTTDRAQAIGESVERFVRDRFALVAAPHQGHRPLVVDRPVDEATDERALTHPGFASDKHRYRVPAERKP